MKDEIDQFAKKAASGVGGGTDALAHRIVTTELADGFPRLKCVRAKLQQNPGKVLTLQPDRLSVFLQLSQNAPLLADVPDNFPILLVVLANSSSMVNKSSKE